MIAKINDLRIFFKEHQEYKSGPEIIIFCEERFANGNISVTDLKDIFSDITIGARFWSWLKKRAG